MPERHTEPPVAAFVLQPDRPSTASAIQLSDRSRDPLGEGIAWRVWDFGDGATGVGPSPVHRYACAGDYTVTLTLATFDGRVGRVAQVVHVRAAELRLAGD